MNLVKWPSIENTYRQKNIDYFLSLFPELQNEEYIILEKLHGSNFQFAIFPDGTCRAASRNNYLDRTNSFQSVQIADLFEKYKEIIEVLQEKAENERVTYRLFGELIGPKIGKGIEYGTEYRILFFGLMIEDELQPFSMLEELIPASNVVPVIGVVKGLEAALSFDAHFNTRLNSVEDNECEGIVIQPYHKVYHVLGGTSFLLKNKNEKFKEKTKKKKNPILSDPEVTRLHAEFRSYITEARVLSFFSKHGEIEAPQQMGFYIKGIMADAQEEFFKDFEEEVNVLPRKYKKAVLNVGGLLANMLKRYL